MRLPLYFVWIFEYDEYKTCFSKKMDLFPFVYEEYLNMEMKFFFLKKKIQNGRLKNLVFQNHQFSIFFLKNFKDWSLD